MSLEAVGSMEMQQQQLTSEGIMTGGYITTIVFAGAAYGYGWAVPLA